MDIRRLVWEATVFVEVVDSPNLKAAAKSLNISQSSVTECLDRLERRVFDYRPLIDRRGEPRKLTALGQSFVPIAREIASASLRFQEQTAAVAGQRAVLAVGTIQGACHDLLAATGASLPVPIDVQVVALDPFTPVAPLLAGQIRWALLPAPSDHDHLLDRRPIFTEPRQVSLAADNRLGDHAEATLDELDKLPWLGIPKGADVTFVAAHRCADIRDGGGLPPNTGPVVEHPTEIGLAIGAGKVIVPSARSITRVFNASNFGVTDVAIVDAPPWRVDVAVTKAEGTGIALTIDELAAVFRAAAADIDGLTPVG